MELLLVLPLNSSRQLSPLLLGDLLLVLPDVPESLLVPLLGPLSMILNQTPPVLEGSLSCLPFVWFTVLRVDQLLLLAPVLLVVLLSLVLLALVLQLLDLHLQGHVVMLHLVHDSADLQLHLHVLQALLL